MRGDPEIAQVVTVPPKPDRPGNEFYLAGWCRYFDFRGVSTRLEYWSFKLINCVTFLALAILWISTAPSIDDELQFNSYGYATVLFLLVTAVPEFAVAVRRSRDATGTGWWAIVPLVSLAVLFIPSRPKTE